MRFYADERLGPTQSLLPSGFLLIEGAPLARTGTQLYGEGEVPIKGDADGKVLVDRPEDEVFRPESLASINGIPLTFDHPSENVTVDNWGDLAIGYVMNPRRGTGMLDGVVLGDIIVTRPDAIEAIRARRIRQLSLGYDADYEQTGDGRGRQANILANHLAVVQEARCGALCSIGDRASVLDSVVSVPPQRRRVHVHLHY